MQLLREARSRFFGHGEGYKEELDSEAKLDVQFRMWSYCSWEVSWLGRVRAKRIKVTPKRVYATCRARHERHRAFPVTRSTKQINGYTTGFARTRPT